MLFDLNNLAQNNEKDIKEDSPTNTELSGTSSSSSVVNAVESPVSGTGVYDFFVSRPKDDFSLVTRDLFPVTIDNTASGSGLGLGSGPEVVGDQWLNLSGPGSGSGVGPEENKQQVRRSRRGPRSRSSQYRGVTFYRRTGRWESHIWDCGKQVYLGGFDTAHAAARAYDRAAIKFRGVDADINFNISDYDEDMKQTVNLNKEEFVQILRRQSTGFSRGSSRYRGVMLQKCGRWEARMGQVLGNKAYDKPAIECNGREGITKFEPSSYGGQISMLANNEGDGHNLDLNLGISITIDGPKASNIIGVGGSQIHHSPVQHANGKRLMNGTSAYYSPGALPLYGQPMASRQSSTMWSGLTQGRLESYEEKVNGQRAEAITSTRLPNWPFYIQSQGQGQVGGSGGTASQVQQLSTAASSGFPFSIPASSSTTLFTHPPSNSFQHYGKGRS